MTRIVLCTVGLFLIAISAYALRHPGGDLASFMDMAVRWHYARIGIGAGLVAYGLIDVLRQTIIRMLFGVAAVTALALCILSFFAVYILAIDTFCLLAGGIFALLGSIELKTSHPIQVSLPRLAMPSFNVHLPSRRRSITA